LAVSEIVASANAQNAKRTPGHWRLKGSFNSVNRPKGSKGSVD
jgi:hypothetical protein